MEQLLWDKVSISWLFYLIYSILVILGPIIVDTFSVWNSYVNVTTIMGQS